MNTLREELEKILVKWNMPTRQVAINEILSLITQYAENEKAKQREEYIRRMNLLKHLEQGEEKEKLFLHARNQGINKCINVLNDINLTQTGEKEGK